MAKYKIVENKNGLKIRIDEVQGQEEDLMKAFQACQEGQCSCQTGEYKKLESMDVAQKADGIDIDLISKEGTKLNKQEIEKCLDFTTAQAKGEKTFNKAK